MAVYLYAVNIQKLQSGLSSRAKHGGTVFSAVSGSIKDLTTVPGFCNHLGPPNLINFAPALVFLSVLNIYSFAIEFGGCICSFLAKVDFNILNGHSILEQFADL